MSPNILVQIGPFELKICQEPYFCMRNPKKMIPSRSVDPQIPIWVVFTDIDS